MKATLEKAMGKAVARYELELSHGVKFVVMGTDEKHSYDPAIWYAFNGHAYAFSPEMGVIEKPSIREAAQTLAELSLEYSVISSGYYDEDL